MNRSLSSLLFALLLLANLPAALSQESDWPRTLPLDQGLITIYKLQVDELNNDTIRFRAALAYRPTADSEPVFGAGWFESQVEIDQASRIVHPVGLKVTDTRFPDDTDDVQSALSAAFEKQSPGWNLDFSLDDLQADLKIAEAETQAIQSRNTRPPQIVYRDHPTLLISIDGEPVLREIENSPYKAVINTPYPMIFDGSHYYLNAASAVWYRADHATGPYHYQANPPADIAALVNADEAGVSEESPGEPITAASAPEIIVSTEPTELVVTEGPAAFVPLVDDLLVLQNSDDDVFMHVSAQQFYIVLAGRWFQSGSLNGPWTYRAADDLPPAFANIPQDSNQADSRVYVAGTQEAREAVLDAQVPQTAAVARGPVDIAVEYDGEPSFEPVDGTDMSYADNTGSAVLESDRLYYLVEDGVWYVSSSPTGPWEVSVYRPDQVDAILPSSPAYNVKYVYVYDSTPDVVYVGYTPGYTGSYVFHNTIVYGTGWYYRPWVSPYWYYPRPRTWGFHVAYNPWGGWGFGLSWGWGPFSVSYFTGGYWHWNHHWHHRYFGYWGPRGYRSGGHGYRGYGRGWHDRGGSRYADNGPRPGGRERDGNLYRDRSQRASIANTRDSGSLTRRGRDRDAGPASYAASGSRSGRNYNTIDRDNSAPVRQSDLRQKAQIRDTNQRASQNMLLADNAGRVYQRQQTRSQPAPSIQSQSRQSQSRRGENRASQSQSQGIPLPQRLTSSRSGSNRSNLRLPSQSTAPPRQIQPASQSANNSRQRTPQSGNSSAQQSRSSGPDSRPQSASSNTSKNSRSNQRSNQRGSQRSSHRSGGQRSQSRGQGYRRQ